MTPFCLWNLLCLDEKLGTRTDILRGVGVGGGWNQHMQKNQAKWVAGIWCPTHFIVLCGSVSRSFQLPAAEGILTESVTLLKWGTGERKQCQSGANITSDIVFTVLLEMGMHPKIYVFIYSLHPIFGHILISWMTKTFRSFSLQIPFYVRISFSKIPFFLWYNTREMVDVAKLLTDQ